jgi:serine protease AprX
MTVTVDRRRKLAAFVAFFAAALSGVAALPATGSPTGTAPLSAIVDPALRAAHGTVGVIVQGATSVESSVRQMGGRITHNLPLIGGFSARVPATDIPRIAELPGATAISLDATAHVQASPPGTYNNVPSVYKDVTKGTNLSTAGDRGQGVTVALIDTGVDALPDIAGAIQPVSSLVPGSPSSPCVNFTSEPDCTDNYGHGTFLAGLIAGNGAASAGKYVGMAPSAKILSLKIAGADGSADVSTIIAAIQWVISYQSQYNIRVLNLSLGTDSTQSYSIDPLDYSVEKAWQAGIVVNVAASNRGPGDGTISKPGDDPFVITIGAMDDKGTKGLGDDVIPNFSSRGPTAADGLAKPDVIAPGGHVVSLAAPGATITTQFPPTMPAPYRRGSGTSMSTAIVSGLVAQMLSAQPTLTPDRVKYELTYAARYDVSSDVDAAGSGLADGWDALFAPAGLANVGVQPSLGTGSLAASRGTEGVVLDDANQTLLDASSGNLDSTLTTLDTTGSNWTGSWLGSNWTGGWLGSNWTGSNWTGSNWTGSNWTGSNWTGSNWTGSNWTGSNWTGSNWTGSNWTGTEEYGSNWTGSAWYGAWDR